MAGGLARHLDIDPIIVRVAFVVLAFFGGAGLLVYGACWLLVPDEATGSAPVRLDQRSRSVALIIVGVLAVLALLGDSWGSYNFPWPLAVVGAVALVILSLRGPATRGEADPRRATARPRRPRRTPRTRDARTTRAGMGRSSSGSPSPW